MTAAVARESDDAPARARADLRVPLLAVASWSGALAAFLLPHTWCGGLAGAAGLLLVRRWRRGRPMLVPAACLMAGCAVGAGAMLHVMANQSSVVAVLARQHAYASVEGTVATDPVVRHGRFGTSVLVRVTVTSVVARGREVTGRAPVLVLGDERLAELQLGARIRVHGTLAPADGRDLAAVISVRRAPETLAPPSEVLQGAAAVRRAMRASVATLPEDERSLIPALVVGDDQGMSPTLVHDFQVSGLTHLSAVSGTNLTLVVGFVLILARWAGVRARGLVVVGGLGVAGFVLLARTEPSVVRAAAMGSVSLIGMGTNGRERGTRALGVAVLVLLLVDPWLATSLGFALSALATAGILFLAPPWRDALRTWMPRWLAESIAVPLAAQLVCTPVIAAISGQVSLVAVAANMLVAPAVGPATVAGLLGGFATLVLPWLGTVCGHLAGWCAWWIVAVAERSAAVPLAALDWSTGATSVSLLSVLCAGGALVIGPLLRRRGISLVLCAILAVLVLHHPERPGWPPTGWVMVACDVGQGDGLVLNAGDGAAVVVDTGPEPRAMEECLDRLGVDRVPVLVLTHFHADHIGGLGGVLDTAAVGEVDVTATRQPESGAEQVDALAEEEGVPVRVPVYGETREIGDLAWQLIGPIRSSTGGGGTGVEEGSVANDASLVLLVRVAGITILMSGDMEPDAQRTLERALPGLRADVLKVPHHGSRYQDPDLLTSLGARLAVISVGQDNDYGHPAAGTLSLLEDAGMVVRRTDLDGDVAVVVRGGRLSVAER